MTLSFATPPLVQDEFAEEMAKRARAAFGVYGMPGVGPHPRLR